MNEETPVTSEPQPTEPTVEPQTETDWNHVAQLIAEEIQKKESTFETVPALHGTQIGEFRIVHEATLGDLLVSLLLGCLIVLCSIRWFFKGVWGAIG